MAKNKSLGLQKFTGVVQGATQRTADARIRVDLIDVEAQVRTQFDEEAQADLDASVKAQGVIQPVVLLAKPDGRYRLIAGERRLRSTVNNNIPDIPAVVKRNLEDWEIRRIQVSENVDRDDITPHDEARAVSQDVEAYGVPKAMEIWNRSEGWISKRTSVAKYAAPVRQLLEDRALGDLEVAHSLNQIHDLDQQEFARLEKRLREGLPLSRDEARGKVHQVKEWLNEAKQRDARRRTLDQGTASGKTSAESGTASNKAPQQNRDAKTPPAREPAQAAAAAPAVAGVTTTSSSVRHAGASNADNQVDQEQAPVAAAGSSTQISNEQALVLEQMVTLFQNGVANQGLLKDVQNELAELGADMNQTEWALWSLYQTTMLPLLGALGEQRAQRYLQRTITELRTAKAQELWNKLHPAADGASADDWTAERAPVAPMPKGWRF